MKIIHIESGLGNQMLSYCEYLAMKYMHPDEDIYIENVIFDIPQCNEVISQWNGYELEKIFGIKAHNIRELFSENQWKRIMAYLLKSEFWDKNWNYPVYITQAFRNEGLDIRNIRGDFELKSATYNINMKVERKYTLRERLVDSALGEWLKRHYYGLCRNKIIARRNKKDLIFYKGDDNVFTGQWLSLKSEGNGMELIEKQVKEAFSFPDWTDEKNPEMAQMLDGCNAVAIHARRGDMLGINGYCYKYGYFKRAVKHIRKNVENPVFVFFTDPGSIQWCKDNAKIFGLNFNKDKIYFADWNKGEESYRDMQLMSHCKHAIITNSSFGWWGAFFINNPNKITISPMQEIGVSTTYHC